MGRGSRRILREARGLIWHDQVGRVLYITGRDACGACGSWGGKLGVLVRVMLVVLGVRELNALARLDDGLLWADRTGFSAGLGRTAV